MWVSRRRRSGAQAQGIVLLAPGQISPLATFTRAQSSSLVMTDAFALPVEVIVPGGISSLATFTRAQADSVATGDV